MSDESHHQRCRSHTREGNRVDYHRQQYRPFAIGKEPINVSTEHFSRITIHDIGSGIAPEDIGRIFEPFYTKKVMGRSDTGLGLAVVWNTMHDHAGTVNVVR